MLFKWLTIWALARRSSSKFEPPVSCARQSGHLAPLNINTGYDKQYTNRRKNKAKAISAELLELNFKVQLARKYKKYQKHPVSTKRAKNQPTVPKFTKNNQKVPESTEKFQKVPRTTRKNQKSFRNYQKYKKVQKCTKKYQKVLVSITRYQKVPE